MHYTQLKNLQQDMMQIFFSNIFLRSHDDGNADARPFVNPFDVLERNVHASVAQRVSEVVVPRRVVDVDVLVEAEVVGNPSEIVRVRAASARVVHERKFRDHDVFAKRRDVRRACRRHEKTIVK